MKNNYVRNAFHWAIILVKQPVKVDQRRRKYIMNIKICSILCELLEIVFPATGLKRFECFKVINTVPTLETCKLKRLNLFSKKTIVVAAAAAVKPIPSQLYTC